MIGWMSEDRTSVLQLLILSIVADNPDKELSAKEILRILSNDADDFMELWIPRKGSIYPAINQLIHKGYLNRSEGRPMLISISKIGERKLPVLTDDLIITLRVFFDFISSFQENLADQFSDLRISFLTKMVKQLNKTSEDFEQMLEESQSGKSSWKEVKIR
jgi:DNA-binding PadR family transcriptional regulator